MSKDKRFVFWVFLAWMSMGQLHAAVNLRILARVADNSISNRDLVIDWLLQNPKSYVQDRRDYYSKAVEDRLLQERLIQVLVEEENRIVGTQSVSNTDLEKELSRMKRSFASRWNSFLSDFEVSELDIKKNISRTLLVDQTLDTRMRDSLRGVSKKDDTAFAKAEDSLQSWLQQLRSRYKVQIFRN